MVNESGRFTLDPSPLIALEKLNYITNGFPTWGAMLLFAEPHCGTISILAVSKLLA